MATRTITQQESDVAQRLMANAREAMRQIAALGGRTAHQEGRAHRFTSAEARRAAAKSVAVRRAKLLAKLPQP